MGGGCDERSSDRRVRSSSNSGCCRCRCRSGCRVRSGCGWGDVLGNLHLWNHCSFDFDPSLSKTVVCREPARTTTLG